MIFKKLENFRRLARGQCPRMAIWALLNYCNYSCIGCQFQLTRDRKAVTFDEAKKVIRFFKRNNIGLVALTGGEPMLHPRLFDIMEEIVRQGMVIAYLTTNNTLINEENAKRMAKIPINIVGVSVRLDFFLLKEGPARQREVARIKKATGLLKKYKVNFYGGVIISKLTSDILRVCETMKELGFDKVSFSYPQTVQKSSWKAFSDLPAFSFSAKEAKEIVDTIKKIKKKGSYPIYNTGESLDEFVRYYQGKPLKYPCVCGDKMFYVDWNCDLYGCFTLSNRIGNVLKGVKIRPCGPHCERCLQHAFKDPGIFYCALGNLYEIRDLLLAAKLGACAARLRKKETVDSIRALLEIAKSPFI